MTVHAFSTCPMGEERSRCASDSFGRVHEVPNLHVADASLLCGPPGVNPQGTIMAVARRNALHFLG
jgi:choline dehydrogenase-like flavoprotein